MLVLFTLNQQIVNTLHKKGNASQEDKHHLFCKTNCFCSLKNVLYARCNKITTGNDTVPATPNITAIWYCNATTGDVPEIICPTIIPGRNTIPMPTIALIVGRISESKALLITCLDASIGDDPSINAPSTLFFCYLILINKLLTPSEMPVIVFPIIIPPIAMKYLDSYHGSRPKITNMKNAILKPRPTNIAKAIIFFKDILIVSLVRW